MRVRLVLVALFLSSFNACFVFYDLNGNEYACDQNPTSGVIECNPTGRKL